MGRGAGGMLVVRGVGCSDVGVSRVAGVGLEDTVCVSNGVEQA